MPKQPVSSEIVVPEIERLIIKPGEFLVVTLASHAISQDQIAMLHQRLSELLPGVEFIIVSDLVKFTVLDAAAARELDATNGLAPNEVQP